MAPLRGKGGVEMLCAGAQLGPLNHEAVPWQPDLVGMGEGEKIMMA